MQKWPRTKLKFRKKCEVLGKKGQQIQNFQVILHLEVPLAPHRTAGNRPNVALKVGTSGEKSEKWREEFQGGKYLLLGTKQKPATAGIHRDAKGIQESGKVPVLRFGAYHPRDLFLQTF